MSNWQILKLIFKQRGKPEQNWGFMCYPYWQWFYAFKTAICLLLNLELRYSDPRTDQVIECIAILDSGTQFSYDCANDYWWNYIGVGKGLFRNWFYFEGGDSSC